MFYLLASAVSLNFTVARAVARVGILPPQATQIIHDLPRYCAAVKLKAQPQAHKTYLRTSIVTI